MSWKNYDYEHFQLPPPDYINYLLPDIRNDSSDSETTEDAKNACKRPRTTYNKAASHILEESFQRSKYLDSRERERLSRTIGVPAKNIKIWFQNRRMRESRNNPNYKFWKEDQNDRKWKDVRGRKPKAYHDIYTPFCKNIATETDLFSNINSAVHTFENPPESQAISALNFTSLHTNFQRFNGTFCENPLFKNPQVAQGTRGISENSLHVNTYTVPFKSEYTTYSNNAGLWPSSSIPSDSSTALHYKNGGCNNSPRSDLSPSLLTNALSPSTNSPSFQSCEIQDFTNPSVPADSKLNNPCKSSVLSNNSQAAAIHCYQTQNHVSGVPFASVDSSCESLNPNSVSSFHREQSDLNIDDIMNDSSPRLVIAENEDDKAEDKAKNEELINIDGNKDQKTVHEFISLSDSDTELASESVYSNNCDMSSGNNISEMPNLSPVHSLPPTPCPLSEKGKNEPEEDEKYNSDIKFLESMVDNIEEKEIEVKSSSSIYNEERPQELLSCTSSKFSSNWKQMQNNMNNFNCRKTESTRPLNENRVCSSQSSLSNSFYTNTVLHDTYMKNCNINNQLILPPTKFDKTPNANLNNDLIRNVSKSTFNKNIYRQANIEPVLTSETHLKKRRKKYSDKLHPADMTHNSSQNVSPFPQVLSQSSLHRPMPLYTGTPYPKFPMKKETADNFSAEIKNDTYFFNSIPQHLTVPQYSTVNSYNPSASASNFTTAPSFNSLPFSTNYSGSCANTFDSNFTTVPSINSLQSSTNYFSSIHRHTLDSNFATAPSVTTVPYSTDNFGTYQTQVLNSTMNATLPQGYLHISPTYSSVDLSNSQSSSVNKMPLHEHPHLTAL